MIKLFALLGVFILVFGVHAITMIHGWGVTPESWTVIGFGWFASVVLTMLTTVISQDKS
jgi:hypothetical protein